MPNIVDFQGDCVARDPMAAGTFSIQHKWTVSPVRFRDTPMWRPQRTLTVAKLMMIAAFVAVASPASAGSEVSSWNCRYSYFYGYSHCTNTWTEIPDPVRDPEQERLDRIARQKEEAKWQDFCKPVFKADQYGVRRASYAKPGCEFGRTE
jgi:hypothetical protein